MGIVARRRCRVGWGFLILVFWALGFYAMAKSNCDISVP